MALFTSCGIDEARDSARRLIRLVVRVSGSAGQTYRAVH